MSKVRTAHTADLGPTRLAAARALLDEVFVDEMTDEDWEHCLGGIHALAYDGDELVGHASLIQRQLLHSGATLRTGYVEGVAVRADRRRRGHGAAMMTTLERIIRAAYDLGALGSTDEATTFYAARGWVLWTGPSSALTPTGITRTAEDDGCIFVLPVAATVDVAGELTCDWRGGELW